MLLFPAGTREDDARGLTYMCIGYWTYVHIRLTHAWPRRSPHHQPCGVFACTAAPEALPWMTGLCVCVCVCVLSLVAGVAIADLNALAPIKRNEAMALTTRFSQVPVPRCMRYSVAVARRL
jgi:hypothetical protein